MVYISTTYYDFLWYHFFIIEGENLQIYPLTGCLIYEKIEVD